MRVFKKPSSRPGRVLSVEQLEQRALLAALIMTDSEQRMIELINRARANPVAEAARYDLDLNEGLAPGTISTATKSPLAAHPSLISAARLHSQDMIDRNFFDHVNPDGKNPGQRMAAAGYASARLWGENIALDFSVDRMHRSLFESPGHRVNLLHADFREIGVGIVEDESGLMGTENFGKRNVDPFFTGVAFSDQRIGDNFFSFTEGLDAVTITAQRVNSSTMFSTTTGPTGGYSLQVPAGTYNLTAEGGELASSITVNSVAIGSANVKVDFIVSFVAPVADRFEANESSAAATVLGEGDQELLDLTIHDGDDADWFKWTATASGQLTIRLELERDSGDVDLVFYNSALQVIDSSETSNDQEVIRRNVVAGQTYYIHSFGYLGDLHRGYDLLIDAPGLPADAAEPNNSRSNAFDAGSGDRTIDSLNIHTASDNDYFRWSPETNGPVVIKASYDTDDNAVDLFLYDADGKQLDSSREHDGEERVAATAQAGDVFYVRVRGVNDTQAGYELQFTDTTPPTGRADRAMTEVGQQIRISILSNDDSDGLLDVSSIRIENRPRFGTVNIDPVNGDLLYSPSASQRGLVKLRYSVEDQYQNRSNITAVDIAVLDPSNRPWTNPDDALDIDGNGSVVPFDVTLLLRDLKINGNRQLPAPSPSGAFPAPYLDPSRDGRLTPQDALAVVTQLRRLADGEGERVAALSDALPEVKAVRDAHEVSTLSCTPIVSDAARPGLTALSRLRRKVQQAIQPVIADEPPGRRSAQDTDLALTWFSEWLSEDGILNHLVK